MSGSGEVCGHRRSHMTKTDKADFGPRREAGKRAPGLGRARACEIEDSRFVPGHSCLLSVSVHIAARRGVALEISFENVYGFELHFCGEFHAMDVVANHGRS